ncbi:MAG: hypothetical protein Q7J98_07990 [Kiritimatiellia bacterium]|nr:hypothetical protein [Kiritimatiellia bacterium]
MTDQERQRTEQTALTGVVTCGLGLVLNIIRSSGQLPRFDRRFFQFSAGILLGIFILVHPAPSSAR